MEQTRSNQIWVMVALITSILMVNIDFTVVNLALVSIAKDLDIDMDSVQWLLSAYMLAWSALVVPAGKMGDILGMRRIYLYGIVLFTVASFMAGVAHSEWFLVLSRVLQGVGGALFVPGAYGLIAAAFPADKQGSVMGLLGSGSAVGLALGPTVGGYIIHLLSWRWIFYVNIPLGLLVVWVVWFKIPRSVDDIAKKQPLDYVGACMLALSLVGCMYALSQVEAWGGSSINFLALMIGSIVLFLVFMFMQLNKKSPLIDFSVFKNKGFLACVILCSALEWCFIVGLFVMGFYLQNVMGFSPMKSGSILLAMTIIYGVLSPLGGRMMDKVGARKPVIIGMSVLMGGGILWAFLAATSPMWFIILALFVYGVGVGFAFPPLFTLILKVVDQAQVGMATSINMMLILLSVTVSMIVTALFWVSMSRYKIMQLFQGQGLDLSLADKSRLSHLVSQAHIDNAELLKVHVGTMSQLVDNMHQAFSFALTSTMIINVVICAVGLIVAMTMIPRGKN